MIQIIFSFKECIYHDAKESDYSPNLYVFWSIMDHKLSRSPA